jgi:hypothetical protein
MTSRFHLLMVTSKFHLPLTKARFVDLTLTRPVVTSDFERAVMTSMFDVTLMSSVFVDLVTSMNSFVKNSLLLIVLLMVSKASSEKKIAKLAIENDLFLTFYSFLHFHVKKRDFGNQSNPTVHIKIGKAKLVY